MQPRLSLNSFDKLEGENIGVWGTPLLCEAMSGHLHVSFGQQRFVMCTYSTSDLDCQ
jgi:hypothetical protein